MPTNALAPAVDLRSKENSEIPFYIAATGPASRPRRTLKHGDTFVVLDSHGDIGASAGGPDGLFHADTRFLSRFELLLNGLQLLLLGSNLRDDNAWLTVDQTNPDIYVDGRIVLQKDSIHIVRTIFVWRGSLHCRLAVRNYSCDPVDLLFALAFDTDFADLFEGRGLRRSRRGVAERRAINPVRSVLTYEGLDGRSRRATLPFLPRPIGHPASQASYHLKLLPQEAKRIF